MTNVIDSLIYGQILDEIFKNKSIKNIPEELITKEICIQLVYDDPYNIYLIPENILDKEICMKAIEEIGTYDTTFIINIPEKFRDEEIYTFAVKNNYLHISWIPKKFRTRNMYLYYSKNNDTYD